MQQVNLVGNLTADPKLYPSEEGKKPYARFSVAVNEKHGEQEATTDFYDITAFGTLPENLATSLHKGQRIIVQGHLHTWQEPYRTADGQETHRNRIGITANAAGPDLTWAIARVAKVARSEQTQAGLGWPERAVERAPDPEPVPVVEPPIPGPDLEPF